MLFFVEIIEKVSVGSRVNCGGSEITVTMTIAIKIFPKEIAYFP